MPIRQRGHPSRRRARRAPDGVVDRPPGTWTPVRPRRHREHRGTAAGRRDRALPRRPHPATAPGGPLARVVPHRHVAAARGVPAPADQPAALGRRPARGPGHRGGPARHGVAAAHRRAADLDDHLPRRPSPRPDPDEGPAGTTGGPADDDRARQGTGRARHGDVARDAAGPPRRAPGRVAPGRGRRPRGQATMRTDGREALQPQGPPGVEPGRGSVPGEDQARQPQQLARRSRDGLRRGGPDGPRPRPVPELPRTRPGVLQRRGRRLRRRSAGVREPLGVLRRAGFG